MKRILILSSMIFSLSVLSMSAQDVIISQKTADKIEKVKAKAEKDKVALEKKLEKEIEKIQKNAEKDIEKAKKKTEENKAKADNKAQQEIEKIRLQENISLY